MCGHCVLPLQDSVVWRLWNPTLIKDPDRKVVNDEFAPTPPQKTWITKRVSVFVLAASAKIGLEQIQKLMDTFLNKDDLDSLMMLCLFNNKNNPKCNNNANSVVTGAILKNTDRPVETITQNTDMLTLHRKSVAPFPRLQLKICATTHIHTHTLISWAKHEAFKITN